MDTWVKEKHTHVHIVCYSCSRIQSQNSMEAGRMRITKDGHDENTSNIILKKNKPSGRPQPNRITKTSSIVYYTFCQLSW